MKTRDRGNRERYQDIHTDERQKPAKKRKMRARDRQMVQRKMETHIQSVRQEKKTQQVGRSVRQIQLR